MTTGSFAHLHNHTEFSMLDGAARIPEVVAAAVADGQPAIAITDHGNMYGVLDFYKACNAAGIKPIIGLEAYMALESRFERPKRTARAADGEESDGKTKLYYHLTLLAETTQGYKNLIKLASAAFMDGGYWYKPRLDWELLAQYHEGLIATTGCLGGVVLQALLAGDFERAVALAARLQDIFGRDNLFVELQDHGIAKQRQTNPQLIEIARRLNAPLLATNDLHYVHPEDAKGHEALLCVQTSSTMDDPQRFKFDGDPGAHCLRSAEEMRRIFSEYEVACDNTLWVAERACVEIEFGNPKLPEFPRPSAFGTADDYLRHLVYEGAKGRYPEPVPADVRERLDYELSVIEGMGFCCPPGTKVQMASGDVRDIEAVGQGDTVVTHDGVGTVGTPMRRQYTGDLVVVTSAGEGEPLRLTPEHPVLTHERGWVAAGTLAEGEHTVVALRNGCEAEPFDLLSALPRDGDELGRRWVPEVTDGVVRRVRTGRWGTPRYALGALPRFVEPSDELMYLIGSFVAEGCYGGNMPKQGYPGELIWTLGFSDEERAFAERIGRCVEAFGGKLRRYEPYGSGVTAVRCVVTHHPLAILVRALVGEHAADKRLHPWLMNLDPKWQAKLIEGWVDGDGHRQRHSTGATVKTIVDTVGETLSWQLWDMAERCGWIANRQVVRKPKSQPGGFSSRAVSYRISWLERRLYGKPHRRLLEDSPSKHYSTKIMKIGQEPYDGFVYNFSVQGQQSYVANGRVVHNCDYFLIDADLVRAAGEKGIRIGPGRGSAAGSAVAYCLGLVKLDPIANDLLFERFLNPGRKQMPDIDRDYENRYRGDMIRYAAERYGEDHVAQIVTFSTIKARAAVRDAARVLGKPYAVGDRLAKAMPAMHAGRDTPIYACFEQVKGYEEGYAGAADLRAMCAVDSDCKEAIDVARNLEGLRRQDGIHASAVLIAADPLTDYLPIQRKPENGGKPEDAPVVTQYEMHDVEELGLLKMDFLGLTTLDLMSFALDMIKANHGVDIDIEAIAQDDEPTFRLLRAGQTIAVFQLESPKMRELIIRLAPTCFEDVGALVALYRPGPMAANMHLDYADRKNGRQPISYLHPDLEPLLRDTQGLMIYQESMMRVAQKFAGYSLTEADNLRKACGKKKPEIMKKERGKFVEGCVKTGYGEAIGTALFDIIEPFADYAFNKSHSYCYGWIAYQTAYLKANYPTEFMAADLTTIKDDKDKTAAHLAECRNMGIEVLVPDVNRSQNDFLAMDGKILYGLSAIRGIGEGPGAKVIAARADGPFTDFYDFCDRVDMDVLNKKTMEALIMGGAFDQMGYSRLGLMEVYTGIVDHTVERRRGEEVGQYDLFGAMAEEPGATAQETRITIPATETDRKTRLAFEKEMLGLYVSDHPLRGYERSLAKAATATVEGLGELPVGAIVTLGGVMTKVTRKQTKKGDWMAIIELEDATGTTEATAFSRTYALVAPLLKEDEIVLVKGRVDVRDEVPKLNIIEITVPEDLTYEDPATAAPEGPPEFVRPSRIAEILVRAKQALLENREPVAVVSPASGAADGAEEAEPEAPAEPVRFRADEAASYELGVKVRRALAEHPGPHPAEVVLVPSGHVYQLGLKVEHDDQLFFKVANLGLETPATSAF